MSTIRLSFGLRLILAALLFSSFAQPGPVSPGHVGDRGHRAYPKRTLGGVSVVDTPIVRAAETFARQHGQDFVYKHIMRSWLFGALIIQHNETLRAAVDPEVHAVAAILHDLGWDQTDGSPMVSSDRRFEVDGAIAARNFIRSHSHGKRWEERRVQLVWDAIALHTQDSIASFKEVDVQVVQKGVAMDFDGPKFGVTEEEYAAVAREFPRDDLQHGVNETITWLCTTKPESTYGKLFAFLSLRGEHADSLSTDTWMQPWGDHFVSNYTAVGNRVFDRLLS
jgi:hypothetical protein